MTIPMDTLTRQILKVVPSMMRAIKKKWKTGQISGVTNSQFHLLIFIQNNPGTSLLDVAQYLGQTSPSTSAAVDEMVSKQLVSRQNSTEDRRKITLTLTGNGQKILNEITQHSQNDLAPHLAALSDAERLVVFQALTILEPLFSTSKDPEEVNLGTAE
ncbi:MAG: MarR family transcriptional regulator [Chloroflexota bacterium]